MSRSTLSVVMPNYNHARYLESSLGAILTQSRPALEVLVIDDASTDNSLEVINNIAARYPSLRAIPNSKNLGVVASINLGLKSAIGDYVYFAGADDGVRPGFFEQSLDMLDKYPQAGLSCCDQLFLKGDTGHSSERRFNIRQEPCYLAPSELAELKRHVRSTFIYANTAVMKRSVCLEMAGFDGELKWNCDDFAVHVAAFRYGVCYIPEPLAALRILPDSYCAAGGTNRRVQKKVEDHLLQVLNSESFRDVLPPYKASGKLKHLLRRIILYPSFWRHVDAELLAQCLWFEFRRALLPLIPGRLAQWYYDRLDRNLSNWGQQNYKSSSRAT